MKPTFGNYVLDRLVAPELSKFTEADVPDLSAVDSQQEHWLGNFILNAMLRVQIASPQRQQVYNFLRRSHSAFAEYALARQDTLAYVSALPGPQPILMVVSAIGHWEAMLGYAWQAYGFVSPGKKDWFRQGDGSPLERLNKLYNRAKHADSALARGDFLEESPLCVWLTNEGLRSTEAALSFEEVADILRDLAQLASVVQDPLTMGDKLKALEAKDAEAGAEEG